MIKMQDPTVVSIKIDHLRPQKSGTKSRPIPEMHFMIVDWVTSAGLETSITHDSWMYLW
jgi:hypothetical protein